MFFRTSLLAAAALLAASAANATVHTITRSGHIVAITPTNPLLNPDGLTSLSDLAVGDAIHFSATYDDADLQTPGSVTNAFGETLVDPLLHMVGLGNGNPVNAVSLTVGSHSLQLSDQACFHSSCGQEFPTGPTLLFHGTHFLGLDSCLIEGGGGVGTGIAFCQIPLDSLTPTFRDLATSVFGYSRSDMYLIQTPDFADVPFIGQFDGPGVAAVPEPATWALLIGGFGFVGGGMRARRAVISAGGLARA